MKEGLIIVTVGRSNKIPYFLPDLPSGLFLTVPLIASSAPTGRRGT